MGPSSSAGRCSLAGVPGGTQVCAHARTQLALARARSRLAVPGLLEGSQCLQTAALVGFSPLIAMETVIKLHGGPWQCAVTPRPGWGLGGDQGECPQAGTFLPCRRCLLLPASPG